MINIAFLYDYIGSRGGAERMIISLANELTRCEKYNVSLVTLTPFEKPFYDIDDKIKVFKLLKKDEDFDKCNARNLFVKTKAYYGIVLKLNNIIRINKIKIFIVAGIESPFFSYILRLWNPKLKIVFWEHFHHDLSWGNRRMDMGRNMAKKYASTIVTLTEQDKKTYETSGAKVPVLAIANFMESYPEKVSNLTSKNVSLIGRIDFRKGWDILVDVWAIIKKNKASEGWKLNIIGGGPDIDKTEKKAKELNVIDSINLIAPTRNTEKYYLESSIYLMTSRAESFGLVLLEAKSYGIPAVSFDCPMGPRDIIRNNIDGFLITIKDHKVTANRTEEENKIMAEKILLLMDDENLRKDMGRKAREDSKRFLKDCIVNKWEELFDGLSKG